MSLFTTISLMIACFVVSGCRESQSPVPDDLQRYRFVLDSRPFEIRLPASYRKRLLASRTGDSVTDPDAVVFGIPGTRLAHDLRIRRGARNSKRVRSPATRTLHLNGPWVLDYYVDRGLGVGSGGTEGVLVGFVAFEGVQVEIECRDQNEEQPQPEWCLPYLYYLRQIDEDVCFTNGYFQ